MSKEKQKRLEELEAKAVAEAKASADAAFKPSPNLLNAASAEVLMAQVDGPPLSDYEGKESVYVGRSVPIAAGDKLHIPIQVTAPGSVVEYALEIKTYDLSVTITAEREEGTTIVKRQSRVDATNDSPLTQKFLVGTVPCLINFMFDNEYSWMRDKVISYKITVTPPSTDSLISGRKRRAKACLKAVSDDLVEVESRYEESCQQKKELEDMIAKLELELEEKKASLEVVANETETLEERLELRNEQRRLLISRLENGWDDEMYADEKKVG